MAVAQSNYGSAPALGLPGQIANEETCTRISRTVESAAGLEFGQPAYRSATDDHSCRVYAGGADFLGIAILNRAVPAAAATPDKYPQYFAAALMVRGSIFVTADGTVAPGDDVYWNSDTKRYGTEAGASNHQIADAEFETSAAEGEIVELSLKNR